ncbi:Exonuclease SbcC [Streptomyces murinus]
MPCGRPERGLVRADARRRSESTRSVGERRQRRRCACQAPRSRQDPKERPWLRHPGLRSPGGPRVTFDRAAGRSSVGLRAETERIPGEPERTPPRARPTPLRPAATAPELPPQPPDSAGSFS